MPTVIASTAFKVIFYTATAVSAANSIVQQRKIKKRIRQQQLDAQVRKGRLSFSGSPVPLPIGRTGFHPIRVYAEDGNSFASKPAGTSGGLPTGTNERDAYLMAEYVISLGEIDAIADIWVEDQSLSSPRFNSLAAWRIDPPGTPSPIATAFSARRSASDKFTGMTHLTTVLAHFVEDPVFRGFSETPFIFINNRFKLANIEDGAIAAERTPSNNWGRTFLTFMLDYTSAEEADIDLASFQTAIERSDLVVQGTGSQITNEPLPMPAIEDAGLNPGNDPTYGDYYENYDIRDSGLIASSVQPRVEDVELRRHEVNGNLSVVDDERDVLGGLRAMVLGSEIFWSLDGKYKLVAPDTSRSEADQVVYTITDEHLVPGTFQDIPPEASEVVNKVVATFANTDKDLAEDSVTFPATGSDLETRLQREDGREILQPIDLPYVDNPYAARAIAANLVLTSRREFYQFEGVRDLVRLEPGDIIRLMPASSGVDVFAKVLSVRPTQTLSMEVTAIRFDVDDYKWYTSEQDIFDFSAIRPGQAQAPTNVRAVSVGATVSRFARLQWEGGSAFTQDFLIQKKRDDGPWLPLQPVQPGLTIFDDETIGSDAVTVQYRVAERLRNGDVSDYSESNQVMFEEILFGEGSDGISGFATHFTYDDLERNPDMEGEYELFDGTTPSDGMWAAMRDSNILKISAEDAAMIDRADYYDKIEPGDITGIYVGPEQWSNYRITSAPMPTYRLLGRLPSGLFFDARTKRITGRALETGVFNLAYEVTLASGETTTKRFSITIR